LKLLRRSINSRVIKFCKLWLLKSMPDGRGTIYRCLKQLVFIRVTRILILGFLVRLRPKL